MKEEKLLKIINNYGADIQQRKLAEEVWKLQEAITEYEFAKSDNMLCMRTEGLRKWNMEQFKEHIAEELADVMVLLEQFKLYYGITDE